MILPELDRSLGGKEPKVKDLLDVGTECNKLCIMMALYVMCYYELLTA